MRGINTYIAGDSVIHRADARVKLPLLLAYSVTLFFIGTWVGLAIGIMICLIPVMIAGIPLGRMLKLLVPLYAILSFTLIFNSFTFDVSHVGEPYGWGDVSAGVFASQDAIPLLGSFGFVPQGFARGSFYVLRIVFLVLASLVVSFTTTSTDLIDALYDFLKPLKAVRVPTEDAAMIISIAIRFIPVTAEELFRIRDAQRSRGAVFDEGGPVRRIKAWQPVLIPLFVGLFRRANALALAMDARCYGISTERTRLHPRCFSFGSGCALLTGLALLMGIGIAF